MKQLDTVLLLALPASGKSEVRTFLAQFDEETCRKSFHMGSTVQLDDYPYVHMMRRFDQELVALGRSRVFFKDEDRGFVDGRDWGTLITLLNEDYGDLLAGKQIQTEEPVKWLRTRIDEARARVEAEPVFSSMPESSLRKLDGRLEAEVAGLLKDKNAGIPETLEGRTVVIEFARGGPDGAVPPLEAPLGYQYSLARLSDEILERSAILYIWVTPEQSRQKNEERADPNDPGSILNHGVPIDVMLQDYGCDDMAYLIEGSDRPDTVKVETRGRIHYLPAARFDNRDDLTTFVRADRETWDKESIEKLQNGLASACGTLMEGVRRREGA